MPSNDGTWQEHLQDTTRSIPDLGRQLGDTLAPGLTVLCHPDPERVGEEAVLTELMTAGEETVSRLAPHFAPPSGGKPRPLADPHLSRKPLRLMAEQDGAIRLDPTAADIQLQVDGSTVTEPLVIARGRLETGVVLMLRRRVTLLLHMILPPHQKRPPAFGLVGESSAVVQLRHEIGRLAKLDYPVLLRGESGTGKELVAKALHAAGPRGAQRCVCVNVGAIPSDLAAAELFGAVKGAFTGVGQGRPGHFQQAAGGSLFLDEIGDASADVQVLLLRALDTRQIQPLGSPKPVDVDVRLISATDVDLESAIHLGEFRDSLYHRLAACVLELPPLRRRKDDIGRLFFYFLSQEYASVRSAMDLPADAPGPQIPAALIARLALYPWPGNVRELRNLVRQTMIASWNLAELTLTDDAERRLDTSPADADTDLPAPSAVTPAPELRPPARLALRRALEVTETELLDALRRQRYNVHRTAKALRVSRQTLYRLMEDCPAVKKASELDHAQLTDAIQRTGGDLDAMVDLLEVSKRGLQLRLSELGLSLK